MTRRAARQFRGTEYPVFTREEGDRHPYGSLRRCTSANKTCDIVELNNTPRKGEG